jgi:hypothetical protein
MLASCNVCDSEGKVVGFQHYFFCTDSVVYGKLVEITTNSGGARGLAFVLQTYKVIRYVDYDLC